jgi:hypothetical protein
MKTGRVRAKEEQPPEEQAGAASPSQPVPSAASRIPAGVWVGGGLLVVLVCVLILLTVGHGKRADRWIPVTSASGQWTTTTTVFGPQVTVQEAWETDCTSNPNASVRAGTCVMKDTSAYHDTTADEYDEYAFNIYYEETYNQIYEAEGTEFVQTALKTDDWWQENLHYSLQEELKTDTCQYTGYTIWTDDPQDSSQEMEVYLSDCEVWDHVTVTERVYEQGSWCQCDVTSLVEMGQQSQQGNGRDVQWPAANVPAGGRSEQTFRGEVTFLGDDYTYTTTTDDPAVYQSYMTEDYYIGWRSDEPVAVSKEPPQD